jgi:hypothetical protein
MVKAHRHGQMARNIRVYGRTGPSMDKELLFTQTDKVTVEISERVRPMATESSFILMGPITQAPGKMISRVDKELKSSKMGAYTKVNS